MESAMGKAMAVRKEADFSLAEEDTEKRCVILFRLSP
jgi:hypothetical protein